MYKILTAAIPAIVCAGALIALPAKPSAQTSAAKASDSQPAPVTERAPANAEAANSCRQQAWPYLDRHCLAKQNGEKTGPSKRIRVVHTSRPTEIIEVPTPARGPSPATSAPVATSLPVSAPITAALPQPTRAVPVRGQLPRRTTAVPVAKPAATGTRTFPQQARRPATNSMIGAAQRAPQMHELASERARALNSSSQTR